MTLNKGDSVETGASGHAELVSDDGSIIVLERRALFRFDGATDTDTQFGLDFGLILAKIRSINAKRRWSVRSPTAICGVRGTEFAVDAEKNQRLTHAGVFDEGHVEVRSNNGQAVLLGPQTETAVSLGKSPEPVHPIEYFKFAASRMAEIRKRQKFYMNQFQNKYKLPRRQP